jgi:hypothetical protein
VLGEGRQAEPGLNAAHRFLRRTFDFQEAAEMREGVEFDQTVIKLPGIAVFLEKELLLKSEGQKERDKLFGGAGVKVEGLARMQAGRGGGTLKGQEGLLGWTGRPGGQSHAQARVGGTQGLVGAVEKDIRFADGTEVPGVEGMKALAHGLMGQELELNLDFHRHEDHYGVRPKSQATLFGKVMGPEKTECEPANPHSSNGNLPNNI